MPWQISCEGWLISWEGWRTTARDANAATRRETGMGQEPKNNEREDQAVIDAYERRRGRPSGAPAAAASPGARSPAGDALAPDLELEVERYLSLQRRVATLDLPAVSPGVRSAILTAAAQSVEDRRPETLLARILSFLSRPGPMLVGATAAALIVAVTIRPDSPSAPAASNAGAVALNQPAEPMLQNMPEPLQGMPEPLPVQAAAAEAPAPVAAPTAAAVSPEPIRAIAAHPASLGPEGAPLADPGRDEPLAGTAPRDEFAKQEAGMAKGQGSAAKEAASAAKELGSAAKEPAAAASAQAFAAEDKRAAAKWDMPGAKAAAADAPAGPMAPPTRLVETMQAPSPRAVVADAKKPMAGAEEARNRQVYNNIEAPQVNAAAPTAPPAQNAPARADAPVAGDRAPTAAGRAPAAADRAQVAEAESDEGMAAGYGSSGNRPGAAPAPKAAPVSKSAATAPSAANQANAGEISDLRAKVQKLAEGDERAAVLRKLVEVARKAGDGATEKWARAELQASESNLARKRAETQKSSAPSQRAKAAPSQPIPVNDKAN